MTPQLDHMNPDRVYERLVRLGDDWADKNAAAQLLEDTTKATLARMVTDAIGQGTTTKAMAEQQALASTEYLEHVTSAVTARQEANRARVRYDAAKIWAELLRSANANQRERMRLAGMD